jgi:glycerol-3-phosphate dehydrogenase (NAD(P)+)
MTRIAVLGAGAWGTAMAGHLVARTAAKPAVTLWSRTEQHARQLVATRENVRYLPGIELPSALACTADLTAATTADFLFAATPIAALPELAQRLLDVGARAPLLWLSKGFIAAPDRAAGSALAHQVIAPRWPRPVGLVSGPSFAVEVAQGLPTAVAVAATDAALARDVAALLRGDTLRAYESDDIAGVEIGGAVKNVLAIATGASDGLGFGHNARAALITRGLAETGRLSEAMGGQRATLMGLAGLGDLVLTCTGNLSRNRRVGLALGEGRTLSAILAELGQVAEGVDSARAARRLAAHHSVDMPICEAVDRVLHEGLSPRQAMEELLRREPRAERH